MRALVIGPLFFLALACSDSGGASDVSGGNRDAAVGGSEDAGVLKLNQLQLKATHNSYHVEKPGTTIPDWQYSEAALDVQLSEQGVRGFELDTHYDDGKLSVHHVPALDDGTTCELLSDCLQVLETWSRAHPQHHTLFLHIEPKDAEVGEMPDYVAYADALDAALLAVWDRERIIAPSDVQGTAKSLRAAVTAHGWPGLEASRGKLLVYLDERGPFHDAYTRGGADLSGRLVFPSSLVDEPIAGVVIANDPTDPATRAAVESGFIVRTRADGVPVPDDIAAQRMAALTSGAQIVSTDFPVAATDVMAAVASAFDIPGGTPSRCNPVTAPDSCRARDIEDPARIE